jgi:nuclear pore complex protein Nup205
MSGKQAFRNVMNILLMGVDALIEERSTKVYGHVLEKVVHLSLQIILLALDHDLNLADAWRPLYQVSLTLTNIRGNTETPKSVL